MKSSEKHIVIIADPIDKQLAGIHYFTLNLIKALLALDNENRYSIIKLGPDLIAENINHISLPNTITFLKTDPIRSFITLPNLIKDLKPDLVIEPAHFGPFNLPKSIKRLTVIHDLIPLKFPSFHPILSVIAHKFLLPNIIKNANLLITNSKQTEKDLLAFLPRAKGKTHSIYLGKEDFFKPSHSKEILKKYKIEAPYFFSLGTIEPRKNLITLLEAYSLFRSTNKKKVQLVISGEFGWNSNKFYKKLLKHPFKEDIKLIGYAKRRELPYLYSQAEAFIYPSFYEGFGLPVLEAMACGTACLISNQSSLPEVGGDAALYFDPDSTQDLKDLMQDVMDQDELKKTLKEKSLKQAQKFSWENFAQQLLLIINKEIQR